MENDCTLSFGTPDFLSRVESQLSKNDDWVVLPSETIATPVCLP